MNPESQAQPGLAVVISGPSGAGKTTVCNRLLDRLGDAVWSVSATTRRRRGNEKDGRDYHFLSRHAFQQKIDAGEFLEYAEYQGNLYGTPESAVRAAVAARKVVLLEIDVQGAMQLAQRMPESVRIFILPPSDDELRNRLIGRKTESPAQQTGRLEQARREIELARSSATYQYRVINDTIERCVDEVIHIIDKERNRR